MSVIDYSYYKNTFGGSVVPEKELPYLQGVAFDLLCAIAYKAPSAPLSENIKRAVAYQTELLFLQGGAAAIAGLAISTSGLNQKVGDRSIGSNYNSLASNKQSTYCGIPISGLAISLLRAEGLMKKCIF